MPAAIRKVLPAPLKHVLHHGKRFLLARTRDLADLRAHLNPNPIIVLGHQKCGTSVVAALLGDISGRSVAIDLAREVDRPTFHRVHSREISLDRFIRMNRLEFSRDIVKEANLTPMYAALRQRFPRSHFAFVIRDPRDNIRSILQRLGLPGQPHQAGPNPLSRISAAWRLVLDGGWLGLTGDDYIAMLAARWQYFADIATAARPHLEILRYEDFRANKVAAITDLAHRLGLPTDHEISGRIDLQYQSRGDHGASWRDYFGTEGLARIESICAPGMAEFGYKAS